MPDDTNNLTRDEYIQSIVDNVCLWTDDNKWFCYYNIGHEDSHCQTTNIYLKEAFEKRMAR